CRIGCIALLGLASFAHANEKFIEIAAGTPIAEILQRVVDETGKTVLWNPNSQVVRGTKIGPSVRHAVGAANRFEVYRAILVFYGIIFVEVGPQGHELYLALEQRNTNNFVRRLKNIDHRVAERGGDRDGEMAACFVPVEHLESFVTLRTALSAAASPAGIGRVSEVPGGFLIVDFIPNIATMIRTIRAADAKAELRKPVLELIELDHAPPVAVADALNKLFGRPADPKVVTRGRPRPQPGKAAARFVPYEPRRAVAVTCARAELPRVKAFVAQLDQPVKAPLIRVVRLQNIRAASTADTLRAVFQGKPIAFVVDEQTNSIIVRASEADLAHVTEVIEVLEKSRLA
ncbi:MAG: hypothetical protein OER88_06810, partial [Planctomycetota bacterium]|nr:hypothetical protein [Planctomycetota bacterium]